MSVLSTAYATAFQISPIFFTGGFTKGTVFESTGYPIVGITQAIATGANLLQGQLPTNLANLDQYFCQFRPLPGSTLVSNQIATYPFYTNQVAANSQMAEPLNVSLIMYCPANSNTTALSKLAVLQSLRTIVNYHTAQGGTYTVNTPASIYTGCLLRKITDVSTGESNQAQYAYQWDFEQPLITFPTATATLNNITQAIFSGQPIFANNLPQ